MLLVVPTVHCPAEEAEEKLKAREWHVSGLVVCRASSSSCGNCFSSTPGHWINLGSCWRSLGTEVTLPGSSCQTKSGLQERKHRKSILTRKVDKTPSKTTDQEFGRPEFREDAKHFKRGGVAGSAWSDQSRAGLGAFCLSELTTTVIFLSFRVPLHF